MPDGSPRFIYFVPGVSHGPATGEAFGLPLAQIGPRTVGIPGAEIFGNTTVAITWRPEHKTRPAMLSCNAAEGRGKYRIAWSRTARTKPRVRRQERGKFKMGLGQH